MTVVRMATLFVALVAAGCGTAYQVSPLAAAARAGNLAEMDRLIDQGEDVDAGSGVNDWPPVIHAIHKGQLAALARLLERGAALDDRLAARALNVASGSGDEARVRPILEAHLHKSAVPPAS